MSEKRKIAKAAGLMSAATMVSRVLGFVRDMALAFYLGATGLSDTFVVAFRIPNLLRELFAEGSVSAAVVPVLTEYNTRGEAEAKGLMRAALGFVLLVVGGICAAGIFFAPAVVALIAPGFVGDPAKFSLTIELTRIMFPFLFFISAAALMMGALNTRRVFFIPALAPAMLNVAIIVSVFAVATWFGRPIIGAAIGVTIGGFLQFLFQVPRYLKEGFSLKPSLDFRNPGLISILMLVGPVTFGIAVSQINILVSNILASYLPDGSVTYLFYSMRLIHFPIGVFGVAMGMAVLPSLSSHAVNGDMEALKDDFSFAIRFLFFICVPAMAGLIALREPIVSTLFQRGMFDHEATLGTARALLYYSLGIWAVVGTRVVAATFYSMKDTKAPVKSAAFALVINILMSLALMGPMQHAGLALAHAISATVNFLWLFSMLLKRLHGLDYRRIVRSLLRSTAASVLMGLAGWGAAMWASSAMAAPLWERSGSGALKGGVLCGAIVLCLGVYFIISRAFGSEELDFAVRHLRKKYSRG